MYICLQHIVQIFTSLSKDLHVIRHIHITPNIKLYSRHPVRIFTSPNRDTYITIVLIFISPCTDMRATLLGYSRHPVQILTSPCIDYSLPLVQIPTSPLQTFMSPCKDIHSTLGPVHIFILPCTTVHVILYIFLHHPVQIFTSPTQISTPLFTYIHTTLYFHMTRCIASFLTAVTPYLHVYQHDLSLTCNNNNGRVSRAPFHVKHAQLLWTGANTKIQNTCI